MDNKEIIQQVKETLMPVVKGGKCILYGSRARGDYRPSSDVDIMILLPDNYVGKRYAEISSAITEQLYFLEMKWNMEIEISPVILTEEAFKRRKTPFTMNVLKDGIAL